MKVDEIISSTKFCHYTNAESIKKIIQNHSFYMSRIDTMNDQTERRLHKGEERQIFVFSFCHSEAKSIPLFYLYSGIDGKGGRIQYTDSLIRRIIQNGSIHPVNGYEMDENNTYAMENYDLFAGWCFYRTGDKGGYYRGIYKERDFYNEFIKEKGNQYLIKSSYWRYENEFRIVVKFKKPIINERICLCFSKVKTDRGVSVLWGPELERSELQKLDKEYRKTQLEYSYMDVFEEEYIRMDLIQRNRKAFEGLV